MALDHDFVDVVGRWCMNRFEARTGPFGGPTYSPTINNDVEHASLSFAEIFLSPRVEESSHFVRLRGEGAGRGHSIKDWGGGLTPTLDEEGW